MEHADTIVHPDAKARRQLRRVGRKLGRSGAEALLTMLAETQRGRLPRLTKPERIELVEYVYSRLRGLECQPGEWTGRPACWQDIMEVGLNRNTLSPYPERPADGKRLRAWRRQRKRNSYRRARVREAGKRIVAALIQVSRQQDERARRQSLGKPAINERWGDALCTLAGFFAYGGMLVTVGLAFYGFYWFQNSMYYLEPDERAPSLAVIIVRFLVIGFIPSFYIGIFACGLLAHGVCSVSRSYRVVHRKQQATSGGDSDFGPLAWIGRGLESLGEGNSRELRELTPEEIRERHNALVTHRLMTTGEIPGPAQQSRSDPPP